MFDSSFPDPASLAGASEAELIDGIAGWSATAAAAEARMFAAIAELHQRRCADPERAGWACDDTDEAAAQLGCALTVSPGRAVGLMDTAVILRDKLPRLGRRFLAGQVSQRVVARIVWLCGLVVDDTVWAALDEHFAEAAASWGVLSGEKLDIAIQVWLQLHDPDAVRRSRARLQQRDFKIGKHDDETGTTSVWGRINSLDAAIGQQRIAAMVAGVCDDDPRTLAQKRSDAAGAVWAGTFVLKCLCGDAECPGAGNPDTRAASVVVHVVADQATLDAQPDPAIHGECPVWDTRPEPEPEPESEPDPLPAPGPPARPRPAVIAGTRGAVLPASLLAEVVAAGAKVRFVGGADSFKASGSYRPSVAVAEFVRARDLTCRIPGCDRPAVHADIDHTNPWPHGPTHPGNLGCKCRLHHLLKTFWEGWSERQLPDGTLQITTPTGHTYVTKPFSALLFPSWATTVDPPPASDAPAPPHLPGRGLMMPTRRRRRAQAKAAYVARERELNTIQRELDRTASIKAAEQRRAGREAVRAASSKGAQWAVRQDGVDHLRSATCPPGHQPDYGDDPPPF